MPWYTCGYHGTQWLEKEGDPCPECADPEDPASEEEMKKIVDEGRALFRAMIKRL